MKFTKGIFASFLVFAFVFAAASTASAYTHMGVLKMGSTGSQVVELQKALNGNGFLVSTTGAGSPGMESSYFGAKTKSAVMAFQSAKGLTADGVVGAQTGTALSAMAGGTMTGSYPAGCTSNTGFSTTTGMSCAGTVSTVPGCTPGAMFSSTTGQSCSGTTTTPSGPLAGTDGSISDVNELSQYNNEEVSEGANDVKVAGFEVEASTDGDIAIKSAKVSVTITNGSGSDNLDDYVDSINVWMGSTKVGTADASDFNEDSSGVWSKTVTLSGATIRSDKTEKFYISFNAPSSLDSGDIDSETVTVDVENLRFIDGSGVTTTETGYDLDGMDVPVSFVDFSTASDTELKISLDSSSPDAGIVVVDDSSNTDNVTLLKGKIKLEGDSDVNIDAFPVTITSTGATNVDEVTGSLTLVIDGEEYTETVPATSGTSATITFDNLNFDMSAGDTISFEVKADVNDIQTGYFEEGDNLKAEVTSTNRNAIDVENEQGDQLSDSGEKSGTALGDYQEFRTQGIALTLVSTSTSAVTGTSANDDVGQYTIKFKVTAVGDDAYLGTTVAQGFTYTVDVNGTATSTGISAVIVNNTDTDVTSQGNYLIEDGQSETFTLTVTKSAGTSGSSRASLTGVKWDSDDANTTMANTYSSNLDSFKTDYIVLN